MRPKPTFNPAHFQAALLLWYGQNARPMPWRQTTNPYKIWLAEVMLQQTGVATVVGYWQRFLSVFPTVQTLADAPLEQVLGLWQGLGYYRRAHLLHACAKVVTNNYGGIFPTTEAELLCLPGIGPYTAAAIASTAFNTPAVVLDGNVERVVARVFRIKKTLPHGKPIYKKHAAELASHEQPCTYANAIMELGATVCTPKNPACQTCPVSHFCAAFRVGDMAMYPLKIAAKKVPHLHANAYIIKNSAGYIYLQKRPEKGMLAALWEVPCVAEKPIPLNWPSTLKNLPKDLKNMGAITHIFSHFKLTLNVWTGNENWSNMQAFALDNLPPISTLMRKVLRQIV